MPVPPKFTKREIEIIPFLVDGVTRFEIAKHLGLSEETVKIHVRNILRKFDATSLRDCIVQITQYREQFIKGMHRFYIPHLTTTLHLCENSKDCEIVSDYDVLAVLPDVSSISELYGTDGDVPRVVINDMQIEPIKDLSSYLFTWMFPKPLNVFETQKIHSNVFFENAFGTKNQESHFNNIIDPTGHLSFGVVFHTARLPKKVSFDLRQGIGMHQNIAQIQNTEPNKFEISVSEPAFLKRYYVRWEWE